MRFSEQYKALQAELHKDQNYGTSGHKHADRIRDLAVRMGTKEVLDYGAGKMTLSKALPWPITNYDPMIPELSERPMASDLVVCSDVLEHIEPECIVSVLLDLQSLTKKVLFIDVAMRPAKKVLADGRNAHLIQESGSWWLTELIHFFEPVFFQTYEGGFVAVLTPKVASKV